MFFGARITFETNPSFTPGGFTLKVWQGFTPLYSVWTKVPDEILDNIEKLDSSFFRPGLAAKAFQDALLRWCIRETEQRLRDGRFDEKMSDFVPIQVTAADVPVIMHLSREKTCSYQRRPAGRELFCSAAIPEDPSVKFQEGPARLAPTTRELCRACDLPDTDFSCSHLTHPNIYGEVPYAGSPATRRLMAGAYCEVGKDKKGNGARCRAGGNDCWEREIEVPLDSPAVPYSPRELPTALDFLNMIWERAFKHPLFTKATFEKPASLSLPCGTQDEFLARVGDLNELLRQMNIPDQLLPDDNKPTGAKPILEVEKLKRLSACLRKNLSSDEHDQIGKTIEILSAVNVVRNKMTHGGAELIDALRRLGITYPILNYQESWDRIRSRTTEALTMLRSSLETLI